MNVVTNNITETLVSLIALCGEIPKDINLTEVSRKTLQNQISKAKKEQVIKIDQAHNRIRLRSPKGITLVKNISSELFAHYMMVTNNHKFKTSEKGIRSSQLFSESVLFAMRNGYQIDNIEITHTPNHFGKTKDEDIDIFSEGIMNLGSSDFAEGEHILPLLTSTSLIPSNEKRYFTSRYLKHEHPTTSRLNTSKISGLLLSAENMYSLYRLDEVNIRSSAETEMTDLTRSIYKNAYGKNAPKPKAIFISNEIPARTTSITKVFNEHFIIPDDINGDFVMRILESSGWRYKLHLALYGEHRDALYDGIYEDTPSWELVTCNYEKIKTARELADGKRVNFICLEWQLPLVKELARKTNCTIQPLTDEQKHLMLNFIKEEP